MISGFLQELNKCSKNVREQILDFVSKLVFNLNKTTGMNYTNNAGGGYVLYTASLIKDKEIYQNIRPDVIFAFKYEFNGKKSNSIQ